MMGMVIMRPIALDVVFAFIGDDNGIAGQQVFPLLFRKDLGFFLFNIVDFFSRKIAAIVDETNVISVEIFPGPIKTGQFTEVFIFRRYMVARIISGIP